MAKYSLELKKKVVEAYHRGEGSYCFLAQKYGITNKRQVLNWVHSYDAFGCEGLMRSRKKQMQSVLDTTPVDTSAEHIKQLEDELLKLRIENAYLKDVRRLRLEEEALLKKSENHPQPPRRLQIKRYSRCCWVSESNLYVLAKKIPER